MEAFDIGIGDKVFVVIDSGVCEASVQLPSYLVSNEKDLCFTISAPQQHTALYPLRLGQRISVTFYTEKCLKMFPAEVAELFSKNSVHFVQVRRTGKLQRIQRRMDYRLPFFEAVRFCLWRGNEAVTFTGRAMDVSGGGMRFLHNQRLLDGDILTAMFIIDGGPMQFNGRISYIRPLEDHPNYEFCTGLRFEHGSKADKERLVRCIFRLQRALMSKE